MDRNDVVRPMGLLSSVAHWLVPAAVLYLAHYVLVPLFVERTGQPYLRGYLIAWTSTMALFFVAALVAYRLEGNPIELDPFARRYRLRRMKLGDWFWTLSVLVFIIVTYFGLGFSSAWLAQWSPFAPHPVFPPEFGPKGAAARAPGTFMGTAITGAGWIALAYLVGWLLNVFGEELWFRGYILPRQERAFGRYAWIGNGLMFALNHIWQPWNLLLILPGALVGALAVQRRKNTWILIIPHGIANAALVVLILLNGLGLAV